MKARIPYIIAAITVMALGYSSRVFGESLPAFAADHLGDTLWASMIYFGFRAVFVRAGLLTAAMISLLFCFGIEFSQLYQTEWINGIRSTLPGSLILGKGFLAVDLARYGAGIVLSVLADYFYTKRKGFQL
ncbi:DUF2809 domain-containing protein [Paenibacillus harenae]|uniref:ribosomal maturation YjgA family protein n=1 Tax=Paenibacillus harenae TaxID=306543 RepID=UPI00041F0EF4|nr:DUF2809 domain-containing protein [Paenibacillus harenae]